MNRQKEEQLFISREGALKSLETELVSRRVEVFCPLTKSGCNRFCVCLFAGSIQETTVSELDNTGIWRHIKKFLVKYPDCTCHSLVG